MIRGPALTFTGTCSRLAVSNPPRADALVVMEAAGSLHSGTTLRPGICCRQACR
jgi:hypothetical protein